MQDHLDNYYLSQAGVLDNDGIGNIYHASYGAQSGGSISSIFKSIIRWFRPILASTAKTVGKQALSTGAEILHDLGTSSGQPMDILKSRVEAGSKKLQDQLTLKGSGLNRLKRKSVLTCPQMGIKRKRVQNTKSRRRKKQVKPSTPKIRDIFNK